jgi:hypothetical protein
MSSNFDDQKFIKKDDKSSNAKKETKESDEIVEIIENLSGEILPESNQQRNLDREAGGVEEENSKITAEVSGFENWQKSNSEKDAWDERSEEVDNMGSINPIGTSAKKSMIWRSKKKKLDEKKIAEAADAIEATKQANKSSGFNSSQKQGFVSQIKGFRQDSQSFKNGGNNNNGYSR